MFRIAEINFGKSAAEARLNFKIKDHEFEVQTFNGNFSIDYVVDLIKSLRTEVDAIAVTSIPNHFRIGNKSYVHPGTLEIMSVPSSIPICDGSILRELSVIEGLNRMVGNGDLDVNLGVFFPSGVLNFDALRFLTKKSPDCIGIGDLCTMVGIPIVAKGDLLSREMTKIFAYYGSLRDVRSLSPLNRSLSHRIGLLKLKDLVKPYSYIFSGPQFLMTLGDHLDFLRDKTLVLPYLPRQQEETFKSFSPKKIISLLPDKLKFHPDITFSVIDAALRLSLGKPAPLSIEEWQKVLEVEGDFGIETREYVLSSRPSRPPMIQRHVQKVKNLLAPRTTPDFAFVIHPLSKKYFSHLPGFSWFEHSPASMQKGFERAFAKAPGFVWGEVKNITSQKTGEPINGLVYTLSSTPKMLLEEPAEVTYKKIETICYDAYSRGAKIIGLGAYTKIVGDGGATINRLSPIPVTTGNSLSASATLWALNEAFKKMGLIQKVPGSQRFDGTAMVIGATGSIGSVSSRLLTLAMKRIILVAPRIERLKELQQQLQAFAPDCEITITTNADEFASEADAIVTATSSFDSKIVDIEKVKPGCVICDCSRPLDFSIEDAMKRPDVLIIESGEVVLPGPVIQTCNMGLPEGIFYACFAETAVLAMENRFEAFTLGRDIDWEKVRDIYKISRAHGVELAAIRGHSGIVSDHEIALVRKLALQKLT
jgi:predicted amino acid dehydrogenase